MREKNIKALVRLLTVLLALLLLVPTTALGAPASQASTSAPVDARVMDQLAQADTADYWVVMKDQADLSAAAQISDWVERGQYVYDQLTSVARGSQKGLDPIFNANASAQVRKYWIVNAIRVKSNRAVLDQLSHHPGVKEIIAPQTLTIPDPIPAADQPQVDSVEWNIDRINAPQVWSTYTDTGQGIVIANIDTGVQFDHPALVSHYRGNLGGGNFDHNYNWFDPTKMCGNPSTVPCDNNGHGTHTMGSMVGDDGAGNQIGVAPGARFIMAKGCETNSCSDADLLAAAQWILAPTNLNSQNPRSDLRPHIVNNSWGGGNAEFWYQASVQAWVAAGIFPAFSAGNAGPSCNTVSSPGDYAESYASGAFDINNVIAGFSSRGSALGTELIKPNIAAPGVSIRSSYPGTYPLGNYASMSGTSMASPHLAGTVALIWSQVPALVGNIPATRTILDQTAIDTADSQCGGTAANNNVWGQGRLDAFTAVTQALGLVGTLQGKVTDAITHIPLQGASVQVAGPVTRNSMTDASGTYKIPLLPAGSYALTVSRTGYRNGTADVTISTGVTATKDFSLTPIAFSLSGYVRDLHQQPIANARVSILGTNVQPATSDASGYYSFSSVPAGSYELKAEIDPCREVKTRNLMLVNNTTEFNFSLYTRADAYGYSCQVQTPKYIEANTIITPGENTAVNVDLNMSFNFYGKNYTTAWVCPNGYISFSSQNCTGDNTAIPILLSPNAAIYPFWDDLVIDNQASVRTQILANPDRFVIEWRNVSIAGTAERVDFEVVLFDTGQILAQYRNISGSLERGSSATLGIEDETGTVGFQYSANQATIGEPTFAVMYYAQIIHVNYLPLIHK